MINNNNNNNNNHHYHREGILYVHLIRPICTLKYTHLSWVIVYFQPYGDDTEVFDELLYQFSTTTDKFTALYNSRKVMIDKLQSYEHGSVEWDEIRITLRKMTGELKNLAEEINTITSEMVTLRDKKQEAKEAESA